MRKTLYLKFLAAYILFGIFGFIFVATFVADITSDSCKQREADALYRQATAISNTYASSLYTSTVSIDSVYRQLSALSAYTDSNIWIVNPSGRVVVKSGERIPPETEVFIQGFNPGIMAGHFYIEGDFFGSFSEPVLTVMAPITANYRTTGYVVIHMALSKIAEQSFRFLNISYLELLILMLLSMIILIFFTEIVYQPVKKITRAAEQYAMGNMRYQLVADSDDEIGYLSATLNYMSDEIARTEEDQKKFIANISHDFRSPLTSMRGFLEAMLDGTIPPESHEKYLGIVLNETERLTKLTNGLLQLNDYNAGGMYLQRTDFDINETIRSVALSFEQTCLQKDITLDLVLLGDQLFVNADKSKIQQVLYNLTDNAIKFSRRGSSVRIETSERHHRVFVSVKDFGIGIPREEQKLIFDRFYKTDLSRGRDKKGTGLGLSIVREIIRAHDENINVISTPGVGSEFIFTLKRSELNDALDEA